MEKFAVDLEKVLNEFEYNEERRESLPTSSVRTLHSPHDSVGALRQLPPSLPSAAIYRKPSFERINLADANFAASPPKPSSLDLNHEYESENENAETFSYLNKPQISNNRNYVAVSDSLESALNNDVNINKQIIIETEESPPSSNWQKPTIPVHTDEKPDLLEYNFKTADSDLNDLEFHNQLPDITTSVRVSSFSVNYNSIDTLSNSLDLISSTNETLLTENSDRVNSQERDLTSNNHTLNKKRSVEDIDGSVSAAIKELGDVLLSDNGTSQKFNEVESEQNRENTSQLDSYSVPGVDANCLINNTEGYETLNGNNLDLSENSRTDVNRDLSELPSEPEEIKLLEDKTNDSGNTSDKLSDDLNPNKVIGFSNDEDYTQSQLLEYLDRVDKELAGSMEEEGPLSEELPDVSHESNVKVNNTDCRRTNIKNQYVGDERVKTIKDKENIFNLSNIKLLPVNSLQAISAHGEDLSAKNSLQNVHERTLTCQSNSLPRGMDCNINSDTSHIAQTTNRGNKSIIALDYKNDLEKNVSHHKSSVEHIHDLTISNGQADQGRSYNPFDEDESDSTTTELDLKNKIPTNPFEDESNNPFDGGPGNPFENDTKNPFESCSEIVQEKESSLEPSLQFGIQGNVPDITSIEPSSENIISNNDSAFGKPSICQVGSITSEPLPCINATKIAETVENVFNQPEKANSSSCNVEAVSNRDTNFETTKFENVNISENPSSDYSPSGSSLDSDSFNSSLIGAAKMIPIKQAIESPCNGDTYHVDEAGVPAEEDKPVRPSSLELPRRITVESSTSNVNETGLERESIPEDRRLGKIAPFWIPDADTTMCMQCQLKFNVIRRRHHCRACGQVLCYKCCGLKARLEYLDFEEARVCQPCFTILEAVSASESTSPQRRQPNPNNPMEYCSTIPPLQQAAGSMHKPPPSVMVPVGVLKREGRSKSEVTKQVMFSDGIRPGGDLTELDGSTEPRMPFRRSGRLTKRVGTPPGGMMSPSMRREMDTATHSFIPAEGDSALPPVISRHQGEVSYEDLESPIELNQLVIKFALNRNLFVSVKRILLDCCLNRECWCFCSNGLACVGQDEIVFLLECLPKEMFPPKDVFLLINFLYQDAAKGTTVSEMSFTPAISNNLLGSRDHGGFLYIRTSYQCTAQLELPSPPYLVAILIHRWETPWARLFPMRLMLRLGAEFRYYPCPLVSVRDRPPLYTDIGHTIINILADFRKYSYTLPSVRGLVIHMEDRQTTINIPRNRYDQVVRALNNSNDSVLAFGANLSLAADSHLVCMQSTQDENTSYHTQAINIHNKPRKVTGASFVVFNGALKVPGLAGKSNIVEDGLMVQVPSETMTAIRSALRDMRDYCVGCGPNAEETVLLQWTTDDTNFNIGVKSCIDGRPLDGVPSIRVHNGTDYSGGLRLIRWTEVFILQCEDSDHSSEPLDISRLSESIARATCLALVPLLDLLSAASITTLAVRTTIHPDNVGYEAGSNGEKLPPLYMKSLDDELVAVVHQAALVSQENPAVLELVFRIMEQG